MNASQMGKLGAAALNASLTPEERTKRARNAVQSRWKNYYELHPEKLMKKRKKAAA